MENTYIKVEDGGECLEQSVMSWNILARKGKKGFTEKK